LQVAELIGIDEVELHGFLNALPNLWHGKTRFLEPGIDLLMSNSTDCDRILICTHLYSSQTSFIILLTEYLKDIGAATFKIYAYMPWFASFSVSEKYEKRLMEIILEHSNSDMSSFRELAEMRIFVCPVCKAQYSLRTLKMSEDGLFQCQNCDRFVSVKETESKSETQFMLDNNDASEHSV
jgi:hypothetical protein